MDPPSKVQSLSHKTAAWQGVGGVARQLGLFVEKENKTPPQSKYIKKKKGCFKKIEKLSNQNCISKMDLMIRGKRRRHRAEKTAQSAGCSPGRLRA